MGKALCVCGGGGYNSVWKCVGVYACGCGGVCECVRVMVGA